MTSHRAFKARVRARMTKTGESYTTARRHLLIRTTGGLADRSWPPAPTESEPPQAAPTAAEPTQAEPATEAPAAPGGTAGQMARTPDALLRQRTGRGWEEWFALLDGWGGTGHTHTAIAAWLVTTHEVPGWWAQTITVGYEQARGLRAPGQRRGGSFEATGSRTVAVPVGRLFDAFADETLRRRWLPDVEVRVRTATAPRTFRADWAGGPTRLVVGFAAVGDTKSRVSVQHEKLAGPEQAAELKAYWRDRLAALKQLLEGEA
ncbi:hypothetical protein [Micromonospora sp. NPDC049497]|uniref:hypothetical protein n=1 Tax=Micromonospora sp. NPDC049497 TaxID=3364273 RepID=UPI0037B67480